MDLYFNGMFVSVGLSVAVVVPCYGFVAWLSWVVVFFLSADSWTRPMLAG